MPVLDALGPADAALRELPPTLYAPYRVQNDWTGLQIGVCTGPVASWTALWSHLKHYGWRTFLSGWQARPPLGQPGRGGRSAGAPLMRWPADVAVPAGWSSAAGSSAARTALAGS